jgi:hypothetical protein
MKQMFAAAAAALGLAVCAAQGLQVQVENVADAPT